MSFTWIAIIIGVLSVLLGAFIVTSTKSKRDGGTADTPFAGWGFIVLGTLFVVFARVWGGILAGILKGFVELPEHIEAPDINWMPSPTFIGSVIVGTILAVVAIIIISRNAKREGKSYGEYVVSKKPGNSDEPLDSEKPE